MAFTSVEIIAIVFLALVVIKMIVLLISPKSWMGFAKGIWGNKIVAQIVALVLAAVVFYYLIQELTIVQIFAAAAFVSLLLVIGMSDLVGRLINVYEKHIKNGTLWKEYWLYTLIWLVLMVWVFIELFL